MARIISFDLDTLLSTVTRIAPNLPKLVGMAAQRIPSLGPAVGYVEMLPALAEFIGNAAGGATGTLPGLPEIGSLSRRRGQYLRRRQDWSDADVCTAMGVVLSHVDAGGQAKISSAVEYTSRCMFPAAGGKFSDAQTRAAVDNILDSDDILSEAICDQLGGHLLYVLTHQPEAPAKGE